MLELVRKTTLPNGVRVVTESVSHVQSISLGIWVATGSRDEDDATRGISHFLEHMLFKGTQRRPTAKHIADEIDMVGGDLNAFTDKECTCYYARTLAEHLPLALDILSDMYLNSRFDPDETARERKVVLEEIKQRDDDPDDLVHDLFAETIYPKHALGLPVIGTAEVVGSLRPEDLRTYMARHYGPSSIIVAASGNLEHERVVDLARETLGRLEGTNVVTPLSHPVVTPGLLEYARPTEQVNFCIGTRGYGQNDEDKYVLAIIDTVLGGSMGSRLFQEIREVRGLAYSVGSYSATHREGGYFAAYGGTSPENYEECLDLVRAEFDKVRRDGVSEGEMTRAKNQFRSSIIMAQESMSSRMNRLGKSEVYFDRVVPLDEIMGAIDAVTLLDVRRVSERIFPADAADLTVASVGPFGLEATGSAEEDEEGDDVEEYLP